MLSAVLLSRSFFFIRFSAIPATCEGGVKARGRKSREDFSRGPSKRSCQRRHGRKAQSSYRGYDPSSTKLSRKCYFHSRPVESRAAFFNAAFVDAHRQSDVRSGINIRCSRRVFLKRSPVMCVCCCARARMCAYACARSIEKRALFFFFFRSHATTRCWRCTGDCDAIRQDDRASCRVASRPSRAAPSDLPETSRPRVRTKHLIFYSLS